MRGLRCVTRGLRRREEGYGQRPGPLVEGGKGGMDDFDKELHDSHEWLNTNSKKKKNFQCHFPLKVVIQSSARQQLVTEIMNGQSAKDVLLLRNEFQYVNLPKICHLRSHM